MRRLVAALLISIAVGWWGLGYGADQVTLSEYLATSPEITTTTSTDVIPVIINMTGTPVIRRISSANLTAALGGGTVTNVTASLPIGSSGGSTPNITCAVASGSTAGCLSSTDWTTFNNKQAAGSYVLQSTTVNGHALTGNITVTAADLGLSTPFTAAQVINETPSDAKCLHTFTSGGVIYIGQTASDCGSSGGSVTGVAATSPLASSGGTSPTITCQAASGSQAGCLSSTDWTTFNAKQAALGFTPENAANKGVANGYAALDASGKVAWTNISGAPTMPSGTILGTTDYQVISNKSFGSGMTWPTFNQNTTGSAVSFTGSLAGDVTGTQGVTSVVKVNGLAIPTSKTVVGTNSSGQFIDATSSLNTSGRLIGIYKYLDAGSATHTTQTSTTYIKLTMVGGGAGGGGCAGGSATAAAGSGGGSGGGGVWWIPVTGGTGYTRVVGAGGAGASSGANDGSDGTASTLAIGGTTYTSGYGVKGIHMTAAATPYYTPGGVSYSPSITSTNLVTYLYGTAGQMAIRQSGSVVSGGMGGVGAFGNGNGIPSVTNSAGSGDGNSGTGPGAGGGGGSCAGAGNNGAGGAGVAGAIIIEEYAM